MTYNKYISQKKVKKYIAVGTNTVIQTFIIIVMYVWMRYLSAISLFTFLFLLNMLTIPNTHAYTHIHI